MLLVFISLFFLVLLDFLEFWENSFVVVPVFSFKMLKLEAIDERNVKIEVKVIDLVLYVLVPAAGFTTSV